jgi:hypothetical protein
VEKKMSIQLASNALHFVIPSRLERETGCLEGSCSIQLSYGTGKIIVTVRLQKMNRTAPAHLQITCK